MLFNKILMMLRLFVVNIPLMMPRFIGRYCNGSRWWITWV